MEITGAEYILKIFEKYNINYIFGYPGGAILPLYDALLKTKKIKHILVRNEQTAAHAASTYGKITNNVGVCIATSGPGATNLVTGIANAYMDSLPLIAITGQVDINLIGTDSFQEADITGITLPITKYNYLIKNIKDLPNVLEKAYFIAKSGRKGPVLIDIPKNILQEKLIYISNYKNIKKNKLIQIEKNNIINSKIKKAIKIINKSKKPLILSGGGAISSGSNNLIKKIIEKFDIPIITTLMGIGIYNELKPLSLGIVGMHGNKYANEALYNCDLLIALGTRFSNRSLNLPNKFNKKVIQLDIDYAEINKNVEVDLSIIGDLKYILKHIFNGLIKKDRNFWIRKIITIKKENKEKNKEKNKKNIILLNPKNIIQKLSKLTRNNCIITTDVGQHQLFVAKYYKFKRKNSLITSGGLGAMGYGLPAAIGAAFATNKLINIILVTGDGSFQMNMAEIATITRYNLPIKILLINNYSLCMVKQLQQLNYDSRYSEVFLEENPDFCLIGSSYNKMLTYKIKKEEEIKNIFKKAFSHNKPCLIECIVGKNYIV